MNSKQLTNGQHNIKKAVIPVAGRGTRFLPATSLIPKELIPLFGMPMIYYIIKEVQESGIEEVVFVTARDKESVAQFFLPNPSTEQFLANTGKDKELEELKKLQSMVQIRTVYQTEALGLGHAVLQAESMISENEKFAVLLGDDLIFHGQGMPATAELAQTLEKFSGDALIGVMDVPRSDVVKYGIVEGDSIGSDMCGREVVAMKSMVEKPSPEKAPSTLATPGRYIFGREIFEYLHKIPRGVGGEYQLTDAINMMAADHKVLAAQFSGHRYDTGNPKEYLRTLIALAMRDSEMAAHLETVLSEEKEKFDRGVQF